MATTRPVAVTPEFAAEITAVTLDLADRIRVVIGDTARSDDQDQAAEIATNYVTTLCRRGWRPTHASAVPDWRSSRRPAPEVARRGAASAREMLKRADHDSGEIRSPDPLTAGAPPTLSGGHRAEQPEEGPTP